MATRKSAGQAAGGTPTVAPSTKKSAKKPRADSLSIKLPDSGKPLLKGELGTRSAGLMLGVDMSSLSKTGRKALEVFLEAASKSVVVILESCSYEPGSGKKKKN